MSERIKIRNAVAVAAQFKRAVKFEHKCSPRSGAKNDNREFIFEALDNSEGSLFWELQFQSEINR